MATPYFTIITGASEGLGKAFSLHCAEKGMNMLLVALPGREIHQLAAHIRLNYPVKVVVFEKDLCSETACWSLFEQIMFGGWKVNMLINNAGIGNTVLFADGNINAYQQLIRLNIMATTLLTRLFLPILKANGPAYILNVSSLASFFPLADKQVYGGTKSYVRYFSMSLRKELRHSGISVTVVCPGGINSNPNQYLLSKSASWLTKLATMDPAEVAEESLYALMKGRPMIIPGRLNRISLWLDKIIPDKLKEIFSAYLVARKPLLVSPVPCFCTKNKDHENLILCPAGL
ncbi:SDR family oxidoreductase [Flavihumibacter sp. ZG627]|uniref:SDR family NAD(P)-dependent oxidoreductase n=1 Tax=Flavihumibacter sp. ZG627 TaxID=1463156 RepID=UPI00069391B0|nr:SDR family NAD(P)-dependent oxidoreductase [Flavihumibacter sp. ZG627]